jgi:hypothetical protein
MATDPKEGRRVASARSIPVPLPRNKVWYLRASDHTVCVRRSDGGTATERGGFGVRSRRSPGRLRRGDIRRDQQRGSACTSGQGVHDFVGFCRLAGRGRRAEGPVCRELFQAEQALEEGEREDGDFTSVCDGPGKGRPHGLVRHKEWVPPLQAGTTHARLVLLPVQWPVLSVYSPAIWLGSLSSVVHAVARSGCTTSPFGTGVQSIGLHRRLSCGANERRKGGEAAGLPQGDKGDRNIAEQAWVDKACNKRRMDRCNSDRAPWSGCGHDFDEVLYCSKEDREDKEPRQSLVAPGGAGPSVGADCRSKIFRGCLCLVVVSNAFRTFLHSGNILGLEHKEGDRPGVKREYKMSPESPGNKGSAVLEEGDEQGKRGPTNQTNITGDEHAHRRCGSWFWWYAWAKRTTRRSRPLGIARCMGLGGQGCPYYLSGAESGSVIADGKPRTKGQGRRSCKTAVALRQRSSCAYHECDGDREQAHDEGAEAVETSPGQYGNYYRLAMVTVGCESVRRRPVATISPRRPQSAAAAQAFRSGWDEGANRCVPISPIGGAPSFHAQTSVLGTRILMVRSNDPASVPATGSDGAGSAEVESDQGPSGIIDARLALATLAPACDRYGNSGDQAAGSPSGGLGLEANAEQQLEIADVGGQHAPRSEEKEIQKDDQRVTRSARRCEAARVVYNQVDISLARLFPSVTPATARVTELLQSYAWSGRTLGSRTSQWFCWLEFCAADGHDAIPVTEAKLLGYIGWLTSERECGRRRVSSSSLPQYMSAVRSMHLMLVGTPVPPCPLLAHTLRAYERWEEEHFPALEVRLGISASTVQLVWTAGMCPDAVLSTVRDCTAVVLAFCLGLRESSALSIQTTDVEHSENFVRLRLSVLKGRAVSRVQPVAYHRTGDFASPLDLFHKWHAVRSPHSHWLAMAGEPATWQSGKLTAALYRSLQVIHAPTPRHGKFTSHSLRIGAHTEQVLLGYPLAVRLARFGWAPGSEEMASLYFDRTLKTSSASHWFFGLSQGSSRTSDGAASS